MANLTQDLKDSAASVLKNPFNQNCMVRLSTYCYVGFAGEWHYTGKVGFRNGDTEGEQKFDAQSLSALLIKMEKFVETLEKKIES